MIVAGFGCRAGATPASLRAALALTSDGGVPTILAAPADRAAIVAPLAEALGVAFVPVAADMLATIDTPTRSAVSLATRGTGSVAEAAALAAAGAGASIAVTRRIAPDGMATCAIAVQSQEPNA